MFSISSLSQQILTFPRTICRWGTRNFSNKIGTIEDIKIEALERSQFAKNGQILRSLVEIIKPSYQNAETILNKDWDHCNRLYLGSKSGKIFSFFMVGRETLQVKERTIPTVYLGLSCTDQKTKGTGLAYSLFHQFIQEAQEWEQQEKQRIPLWYTTATPSICHSISTLFRNSQPRTDGLYSGESGEIIEAIKEKMGWPKQKGVHPFVVKGITHARYSPAEAARIAKIKEKHNFTFLDDLGVHEDKGDRLIGICYLPRKDLL